MKLNKKGLTLVELLVSIVLVSIILVFLFNLLNNLRDATNNNNFVYNNQVNRTEAIYTIQNDLNKYPITKIEENSNCDGFICVNFHLKKNNKNKITSIVAKKSRNTYYLNYSDTDGNVYSWEMKDATLDSCASFEYYSDSTANSYFVKLNIKVYNKIDNEENNKDVNNVIDDVEITYSGLRNYLENSSLTSTNGKRNIGNCA